LRVLHFFIKTEEIMLDTLRKTEVARASCEITEELVAEYENTSLHDRQAKRNASMLRAFMRQFSALSLQAVQQWLVDEKKTGKSNKTLSNYKTALSTFATHLRRRGHIDVNPCRDVDLPRVEELPPIILTRAEAAEAISMATGLGCVGQVIVALYAGLRASEICRLRWTDIDTEHKGIVVRKAKGKRFRVVPMCRRVSTMLARQRTLTGMYSYVFPMMRRCQYTRSYRLLADAPRSISYMMDVIAPIREAIPTMKELPPRQVGRGWHAFRHTFASWAVAENVSIYKLARWLGHQDVRTTQRYARLLQQYDPEIERVGRIKLESPRIGVGTYDEEE
jgi:integrase